MSESDAVRERSDEPPVSSPVTGESSDGASDPGASFKLAQLTPGTGHFFCGSCLRDHTLATALRRRGHDAMMVPIYLPFVLEGDDSDASGTEAAPVRLGGIDLYFRHKLGRRWPKWAQRWLGGEGLLRWGSRRGDMTDASALGSMAVATVSGDGAIGDAFEQFADWLTRERPEVVGLSNAMLSGLAPRIRERLSVPVIATLQGELAFLDALSEPFRTQAWTALREQAKEVDHFVAVSRWYGELMAERLGLASDRWSVVHNGIELSDFTPADAPPERPTVGFLARLCTDKGFDTFVDAFLALRARGAVPGARMIAVGVELGVDRSLVADARRRLAAAGLAEDVEILPNATKGQKLEALRRMSLLSVPALYGESFGLYLLEAFACGVPVVQPRHAAFPELLEASGGGVLCESNDADALGRAWEALLLDEPRRRELGARGRESVETRFHADRMAAEVEALAKMLLSR